MRFGRSKADHHQIAQNRAAIGFARAAAERFGSDRHVRPIGKLHGAADRRGMRALVSYWAHLDRVGEPYTRLDQGDMRRITGSG